VLETVLTVGAATGHEDTAHSLVDDLRTRVAAVRTAVAGRRRPRVAMLEWTDPPFSSGHWVPDMVDAAGGVSVLGEPGRRSEQVAWSDLTGCRPDVVVVAPCGYHLDGAQALAVELVAAGHVPPAAELWAVDADAEFVRPGPRLVDGVETLAAILHPDAGLDIQDSRARRIDGQTANSTP
jgi:iron complex transport system substrate-binding protein